jgi:FkbH-like protein
VNWKDKVSNLKAIARDLNIGVDSLVFVDDSDFEINYVKQYLPEITVLRVPSDIFEYPMMLRKTIALFYNISEAKEDLKRIRMYAEQASREEFRGNFSNLEDFLKSLGLHIYIYCDDESVIPRMAQMMQKTNQFNLTTKRYTEADMRNFVRSDDYRVFAIEVKDNFGSYGITGLVIIKLRLEEVTAELDTLLLSCRVIGRNIEHAFFDFIIERLKELGIMTLHGKYFKTPKNGQVQDLCESYGMTLVSYTDKEKCYRIDLVGYRPKHLDYIEVGRGGKN